jgi:hypothetical protein
VTDQQSLSDPAFPAPTAVAGHVRPLRGVTAAATVLIALSVVTEAATSISHWHTYQVVRDYLNGAPTVTETTLNDADAISAATSFGFLAVLIAAGTTFLLWLWRARKNSEILCSAPHQRGRGWTIGGWFCPVVNLWFPVVIVNEIWKASSPGTPAEHFSLRRIPGSALVGWWWACFLAGNLLDLYITRTTLREPNVESLYTAALGGTITTVLSAVAGLLIILVMRQITGWQSRPRPSAGTTSAAL